MLPAWRIRRPGGPALQAQTEAEVHELVGTSQLGSGAGIGPEMENGGSGGGTAFVFWFRNLMRVDINLASQPYEDARRFWLRWGAALAAACILSLALLVSTATGW